MGVPESLIDVIREDLHDKDITNSKLYDKLPFRILISIKRDLRLKRKNAQQTFFPFAGMFEGIKAVDYPSIILLKHSQTRYITNAYKTEATGNTYMHTRLIEICTDTKRQKHMQTQKCKN